MLKLLGVVRPHLVDHAARPSHDLATSRPFDNFDVKAVGTLSMLEAARRHGPEAVFVHMSTNEVYGDRANSVSILEAFDRIEAISGKKMQHEYVDKNREGDHICYISDLSKMLSHYPGWGISKTLDDVFEEIEAAWRRRAAS